MDPLKTKFALPWIGTAAATTSGALGVVTDSPVKLPSSKLSVDEASLSTRQSAGTCARARGDAFKEGKGERSATYIYINTFASGCVIA
jgi:hypothetical protein